MGEYLTDLRKFLLFYKRRILAGILASVLIYTLVLGSVVFGVLNKVESLSVGDLITGQDDETGALRQAELIVDETSFHVRRLEIVSAPAMWFCDVVSWVPVLNPNCAALDSSFARFSQDQRAASDLIKTLIKFEHLVDDVRSRGLVAMDSSTAENLESLGSKLVATKAALSESANQNTEGAEYGRLPLFNKVEGSALSAESQLIDVASFGISGVEAFTQGMLLANQAKAILNREGVDSESLTGVTDALSAPANQSKIFLGSLDSMIEHMPEYVSSSEIGGQVRDLRTDAQLIVDLLEGVLLPIQTVTTAMEAPGSSRTALLDGGLVQVLDSLEEQNNAMTDALFRLEQALPELQPQGRLSSLLGGSVAAELQGYVERNTDLIGVVNDIPPILSALFGSAEEKRYLVLGTSSDELRASGGFISSVWMITFANGILQDIEYTPILEYGESAVLSQFGDPPFGMALHMGARARYLRDVTWSPHFPTVAQNAIEMSRFAGHGDVDGAILLTQWAFVYLVESLGAISIDGVEYRAEDIMPLLENRTDADGTSYLRVVFEAMLASMTFDRLSGRFTPVMRNSLRSFREKQIMIYSADAATQLGLESLGWSGAFALPLGDSIGVYDSNVGWNKTDRNIERAIDYRVQISEDGAINSILGLEYRNTSVSSETVCGKQTQPVTGTDSYQELKNDCYWNYLRAYLPFSASSLEMSSLPVGSGEVAVRSGSLSNGTDTAGLYSDESGQYAGGLLVVEPGETKLVEMAYQQPKGSAVVDGDEIQYDLRMFAQSGVLTRRVTLNVEFPVQYELVDIPVGFERVSASMIRFSGYLDRDLIFSVRAAVGATG